MNVHEYQAKEVLKKYGIPTLQGIVVDNAGDAGRVAYDHFFSSGKNTVAVKAQIHAGGRGAAGGVKVVKSAHDAYEFSRAILGKPLVTRQTGKQGRVVRQILLEEGVSIDKEFYLGVTLDRRLSKNVIMVSTEGGIEIEEVAEKKPDKIRKIYIDPLLGLCSYQARELAFFLGLTGQVFKKAVKFINLLVNAYEKMDATIVEINPMVVTKQGDMVALDAKVSFDDNALFRHKAILDLRDVNEEEILETEASSYNLNYVKLDGNVGCMVNGAGLAMATMDMIKLAGGEPANFLDVGGSASAETVENGFRIILSDKNVNAVLVNIFGGIVRCDRVASGIIKAAKKTNVSIPVIVRLEGTNAEEARRMLDQSSMSLISANSFNDVTLKVTDAIKR